MADNTGPLKIFSKGEWHQIGQATRLADGSVVIEVTHPQYRGLIEGVLKMAKITGNPLDIHLTEEPAVSHTENSNFTQPIVPSQKAGEPNLINQMNNTNYAKELAALTIRTPGSFVQELNAVGAFPSAADLKADGREQQWKAMRIVREYVEKQIPADQTPDFHVLIVWFTKVLQNWKAMVITTLPDQMYYEVTYDGDRQRTYLDAYNKTENVVVND